MVLLNVVQSKFTVVQYNLVTLALNWPITTEAKNPLDQSEFQTFSAEKTRASNLRLVGFLLVKSGG